MTGSTSRLSDELLRRSLSELAANPDGSALLTDVLRTVDSTAQVGRRPWDAPGWGRAGLLVATVVLITAALGAAVVFSALRPQPQPTPSAPAVVSDAITVSDFVVPFTYRLPQGETAKLGRVGRAEPAVIYSRQRGFSDHLSVFIITQYLHACPTVTGDPADDTLMIGTEPSAIMQALRDTAGVGLGPISTTTMGNLPAVTAEVDPAGNLCGHYAFHENGLGLGATSMERTLDDPSRLIVARTETRTIGVLISSATQDELVQWLPIAQAYVDSFVFETGALPSAVAEPTPSAAASLLPTVPGVGSSLVLQHFNGQEGAASAIAHTAFAPGAASGAELGGLPDNAINVRWAPDGSRVTYFSTEVRRGGLSDRPRPVAVDFFLANSAGSGTSRVELPRPVDRYASTEYWAGAVWSPTGASFAIGWSTYQCSDGPDCLPDGGYDIFDQAGSLVTTIEFPDLGNAPIWSPDGRAIGWFTGSCPNGRCATDAFNWRLVDGDPTVTTVTGNFGQVVWAPDGRLRVVTLTADGSPDSVQTMTADGGDSHQVGWTAHGDAVPIWSPDGGWLAAVDGRRTLWLRDVADGTEVSQVLPPGTDFAAWSPDSRSIALFTESPTNPSGYAFLLVGINGGGVFALGDGEDFGWR